MADTKQRILEGLRTCLADTLFNDIAISDLCAQAGISKKTFYNHYPSKQDLVPALLEEDFFNPVRELRKSMYADQLRTMGDQACENSYRVFSKYYPLYRNIMDSIGKLEFFHLFAQGSANLNREIYVKFDGTEVDEVELDFMCGFLGEASAYSLRWWMDRGFQPDAKTMGVLYNRWAISHVHRAPEIQQLCDQTAKQ